MARKKGTAWRLPFRYKKNGKDAGSFFTREPGGKDLNLRTKNAEVALKRLSEAKKGKRVFEDDGGGAAAAVAAAVVGTGGASTPLVVEPAAPAASGLPAAGAPPPVPPLSPTYTAPPALPRVPPAQGAESPPDASGGPTPVMPDGYIPPAPGWADAVASAAGSAGPTGGEGAPEIDDEFLDQVVGVVAEVVVELQISAQAWLIKRRAKIVAGPIPPDDKGRELGRKLWTTALKKMFPDVPDIPEWLLAPMIIAALTVPRQIQDGTPIKPNEESAPAPAAA